MSDDHHYRGGHELEGVNPMGLFRIVVGLGIVTLLAATAVVQWFYKQREQLILDQAAQGSFILTEHRAEMEENLEGVDATAKKVLEDPTSFAAAAPPPGWVHPDDLQGGAAPAPEDPEEPMMPEGEEGEPTEGDAPEGDAPEGDAPEGDAPEDDAAEPAKDDEKKEEKAEPKKEEKAEPKKEEKAEPKPKKEEKAEPKPKKEEKGND